MFAFPKRWLRLMTDDRAVTSLEYGIIAGILVIGILTGFNNVGSKVQTKFNTVAAKLS